MTHPEALATEISAFCEAHADAAFAARWNRYFTEGYDAWGIDPKGQSWAAAKEEWTRRSAKMELAALLNLGELLWRGKYEEGALAIHFAAARRDRFDDDAVAGLGAWFEAGIRNWAHTDVLCGELLAPLLESGRVNLKTLAPWRASPLKYQRRAVPVAMLGLLKAPKKPAPLLAFLRPLMMDPERVVQQGLGWFLRETWKRQPAAVEDFLLEWKDRAPRLIFQYATEKIPAAARVRFRRARGAGA